MQLKALAALILVASVTATPLARRAAPNNTVKIVSAEDNCIVVPRDAHTNVGDSEHPGGMQVYCTQPADSSQGQLPNGFWKRVTISNAPGASGQRQIQLTGCINPNTLDRLNANDSGGQYDSSGGDGGRGNPRDSVCTGYNHYVELLEPGGNRACIRCCDSYDDCPLNTDTAGCPAVIKDPQDYSDC